VSRRIAVIGAGWAGLSAAVALHDAGCAVSVFEAGHTPGGRAQRVQNAGFQAPLDNGQHLLLGAYRATLALMTRLGRDPDHLFLRLPLTLARIDGGFALRAPRLPAPLHAAAALLGARGPGMRDRLAAMRFVMQLRRRGWRTEPGMTVGRLLIASSQPTRLIDMLWHPLCIAALNTPPDAACAQLFCNVLRDTLDAPREASDLLLPRTDLSALWPDAAAALCDMRHGHAVRTLQPDGAAVLVDGERFDAAVLAVSPRTGARLLHPHPEAAVLVQALAAFRYLPIATLTVQLASPIDPLPCPMMMLREDPARAHVGQWLFDRTRLLGLETAAPELAIVASDAGALAAMPRDQAQACLVAQLQSQLDIPAVVRSQLIIEKNATFCAVPGLARPGCASPWPRLALAGDWTDTGYPGVLEGAVRSGMAAASHLLAMQAG
jgi:squalene-associated FAD-dependent desaturase